jgi:hypothetical protein
MQIIKRNDRELAEANKDSEVGAQGDRGILFMRTLLHI